MNAETTKNIKGQLKKQVKPATEMSEMTLLDLFTQKKKIVEELKK
jgi:hypothetical protein